MHARLIRTKTLKDNFIYDYAIVGDKNNFIKERKEFIADYERNYNN